MWILYTLLGIIGFLLVVSVLFAFFLAMYFAKPHRYKYEETKENHIKNGMYHNYDELKKEDYIIEMKDEYKINARYFNLHEGSKKYVIIAHGFTVNQIASSKYIPIFDKQGYNVITYDERAHGVNEGGICSMSLHEAEDLITIISDTYSRFGDDIYLGLHGESMGGATVVSTLKYNPNIKFVISDCPFSTLEKLAIKEAKRMFHAPIPLIKLAGPVGKIFFGYNAMKVRPIDDINNSKVPLLLCHGDSDKLISYEDSIEIYESYNGYKEIYLAKGADHATSVFVDYKKYEEVVVNFLNNIKNL